MYGHSSNGFDITKLCQSRASSIRKMDSALVSDQQGSGLTERERGWYEELVHTSPDGKLFDG